MNRSVFSKKKLLLSVVFGLVSSIFYGCGTSLMESNSKANEKGNVVPKSILTGNVLIGDRTELLIRRLGNPTSTSTFKDPQSGEIGEIYHYHVQNAQYRFLLTNGKYITTVGAQFVILANSVWKIVPNPNPQSKKNINTSHQAASILRGSPGVAVAASLEWK